jgi:hypothetical protein
MALKFLDDADFTGKIGADGGIEGLTLANGGISGSNYDITGVNSLTFNDPGEGLVFTGTTNVFVFTVDDATDSILRITNASALDANCKITDVTDPTSAQDAATKSYVDTAVAGVPQGDITNVSTTSPITGGGSSGSVTIAHATSGATAATYTAATIAVNATGHITSASSNTIPTNNNQLTNGAGYITSASLPTVNNGTLTMSTSTGLDGASTFSANQSANSTFTVTLDLSELVDMTGTMIGTDEFIVLDAGAERRKAANEIGLSIFNNDSGFISSLSGAVLTTGNQSITGSKSFNSTTNINADLDMEGGQDILLSGSGRIAIDGDYGSAGQVLTSTGSVQEWSTPSSGGITGSGVSGRIPVFNGTTSVLSSSGLAFNTTTKIFSAAKIAYTPFTLNRGIQYFGFGTSPGSTIKLFNLVGSSSQGINVSQAQGDNYWVAPAAGRIKSITVRNVKDTPTSGNTRFKIYKNGSNSYTSSYITPTGANSVGQYVQVNNINHTFSNLDRINIGYQGQTSTTNWGTCALTIVIQFTDYEY